MAATMKDVAKQACVSVATVSHVINGTRYVSDEVRSKVLKTMRELGYTVNTIARSLRNQKTNTVGLIVPDISNFFFSEIVQSVESVLRENNYKLVLVNTNENIDYEKEHIRVLKNQLIDGLIVAPATSATDGQSYLSEMIDENCPIVFIDRKPKGYVGDCILANNSEATYNSIDFLIKKGHEKIGIITGIPGLTTTDERLEGYRKALKDNGLGIDEALIKIGDSKVGSGYKLTKELLSVQGITAIFVANNLMTIGSIKYLIEKQINIPKDIAIIGFDDYEWASISNPPLTVVKQPAYEIGEKAAQVLLERIKNPGMENNEYRLDSTFIVRNSC